MDTGLFVQGIMIGLMLAVPVGPLSLVCIQRSVSGGRLHGIVSGLGITTADSVYAAVVLLGLTMISGMILANQLLFRLIAGIALILIGVWVFLSVPPREAIRPANESYLKDFITTFAIGIANPFTIIFFLAIIPAFGVVFEGPSRLPAAEFIAGFICGSVLWWVILCGAIGTVRSRLSCRNLQRINQGSGILIICIGAGMLAYLFLTWGQGISP